MNVVDGLLLAAKILGVFAVACVLTDLLIRFVILTVEKRRYHNKDWDRR